jgi:hypothetical protein
MSYEITVYRMLFRSLYIEVNSMPGRKQINKTISDAEDCIGNEVG